MNPNINPATHENWHNVPNKGYRIDLLEYFPNNSPNILIIKSRNGTRKILILRNKEKHIKNINSAINTKKCLNEINNSLVKKIVLALQKPYVLNSLIILKNDFLLT